MTTKMSQSIRQAILHRLLEHRFATRQKEIEAAERALAEACWERLLSEADRRLLKKIPAKWLPSRRGFRCNFAGMQYDVVFGSGANAERPVPEFLDRSWQPAIAFPRGDAIVEQFEKLAEMKSDYKRERDTLAAQTTAMLGTFGTLERLREAWPEVVQFTLGLDRGVSVAPGLPVVPLAQLNAALGLKSPARKEARS